MDTLGSRLRYARNAAKLKQHQVAAAFDIDRANISQWESDTSKPELDKFGKLAEMYGTSIGWLLDGKGLPPIPLEKRTSGSIIKSYDPDAGADPDHDPTWPEDGAGLVDGVVIFKGQVPGSQPEFSAKPGMGEGQLDDARAARVVTNGIATGHPVINEWLVPHDFIRHALDARPQGIIILQVVGHSMEPRLLANDRVMVDTSQDTWIGDAVYVIDDGDTVFQVKTLRKVPSSQPPRFEIVSEATPDKVFERGADEFRIVGRVVGRISKM